MNDRQKKDYVDCGGLFCPYCGADSVSCWDAFTTHENGEGRQKVECEACGRAWMEIYRLETIEEL